MRRSGEPIDAYSLRAGGKVRDRFERWLAASGVDALFAALERRAWRDTDRMRTAVRLRSGAVIAPEVCRLWRLDGTDLARVRAAAVERIEAAGGRILLGPGLVAYVEGGELRISLG